MVNQIQYTYRGMNQDVTKSKHSFEFYYSANNIRIITTDSESSYSATNELGNNLEITIPTININTSTNEITYNSNSLNYINQELNEQIGTGIIQVSSHKIIGYTISRNGIILFTTSDEGIDCIWYVKEILEGIYEIELLYVRKLGFSVNNLIQAIYNYENQNIQKIYWVDGVHQIRNLNITHNLIEDNIPLIDIPMSSLNAVGSVSFSQPFVEEVISGGDHTSGKIQYAYNLYRLNSSQTKISPISELISLDKGENLGGGDLDEIVGATPVVKIENIDLSYTHIKIYAIKYTSLNEIPLVNLIEERELDNDNSLIIYDDGSTISSLSLEEFLFLGSDPVVPQHIESKDNRLFLANLKTKEFVIPDELDCRAYSFPINSQTTKIFDNISSALESNEVSTPVTSSFSIPYKHDAINLDLNARSYQYNSEVKGGTGKYIEYEIVQKTQDDLDLNSSEYTFLKDREVYRIGIEFTNTLGQKSLPKWIADFKTPSGNLEGNYNTLKVTLKPEFYVWLNTFDFDSDEDKPVGYNIIRADRTLNDRSIICQGILSGMMVNSPRTNPDVPLYNTNEKVADSVIRVKRPNILVRTFQDVLPLRSNGHLKQMQFGNGGTSNPLTEIQHDFNGRKADTYQYTRMFQMYSPEVFFGNVSLNNSLKYNVIGGLQNTHNAFWGQNRSIATTQKLVEGKAYGGLSPYSADSLSPILGNIGNLLDRGLISDVNGSDPDQRMQFSQFYRRFSRLIPASTIQDYNIYGSPELTTRGQSDTTYNNDPKFKYNNTLQGLLTDAEVDFDEDGVTDRAIINVNSNGSECITFVDDNGTNDDSQNPHSRKSLRDLYNTSGIGNPNVVLVSEMKIPEEEIYMGNLYGGNSYEDKKRTSYIKIGMYKNIEDSFVDIDNAGDTYVQDFNFERIVKTDTEIYNVGTAQLTEIVSATLETTIDLKNRNDISLTSWENRFQPRYDEYHNYNRVYSQQSNLIQSSDTDFTFQRIKEFDTRIQSTSLKIPNEEIDSWTNILTNEVMDLNGKYGPINGLVSFNDNIFALQDEAISAISINPRVQVQGSDGVGIELGTGGILYDFNYLTTKSGSINKWSNITSSSGFYYFDALNKSWNKYSGNGIQSLTDMYGLHSYFFNNIIYEDVKLDNPVLKTGVTSTYNPLNNEVYLTVLQGKDKSFTICFNELTNSFTSFYDYIPSFYIIKGFKMITTNPDNNELWEHFKGNYNEFYGLKYDSSIRYLVNPQQKDNVFNNIEYKSEFYLDGVDQPKQTLTHIKANNEYLSTNETPLILNSNINRKFRMWRANIPRARSSTGTSSLDRMRGHWIYLDLILKNNDNYKMILHDMFINYTSYNY